MLLLLAALGLVLAAVFVIGHVDRRRLERRRHRALRSFYERGA